MMRKSGLFLFLTCMMASLSSPSAFAEVQSTDMNAPTLSSDEAKREIERIDARIQALEQKKATFDSRAKAAEKDGDRLHFRDFTTARMFYARQEHFQTMSYLAQKEIEALKNKKEELQKQVK